MKPIINENSCESSGVQSAVKFGIKSSGLAHIFNVLRNQLYSDKILAVVREYSCNAVDAMIDAGKKTEPIEVTLPNSMNPNFMVRDFGEGLTDKEIQDIYAFYGESTKRNTNEQTGMLGIGSKSAFAYGDNFIINSYVNGVKSSYNAFIDPSQVGQISKLSSEPTTEADGIEIVVPVKSDDYEEFRNKARILFEHFVVKPVIKGTKEFSYSTEDVLFKGEGWRWVNRNHQQQWQIVREATVVMGNIGYPINENELNIHKLEKEDRETLSSLVTDSLVLEVPIGELDISASREKLQYTDRTRENLINALRKVRDELNTIVNEKFENSKTLFDAKILWGQVFDYGSPMYPLRDALGSSLKFNGEPVGDDAFKGFRASDTGELWRMNKSYRSARYKKEESYAINCKPETLVIEMDAASWRGYLGRVLPLVINEGKDVYIVKFANEKAKKEWKDETGFDGELTSMSSLTQHKLSEFEGYSKSSAVSGRKISSPKSSAKVFALVEESYSTWHTPKSDFWEPTHVDLSNDSGVYVVIDRYEVRNKLSNGTINPASIQEIIRRLAKSGLPTPTVYGVKAAKSSAFEEADGWVNLWSWLANSLKDIMIDGGYAQRIVDYKAAEKWTDSFLVVQHTENRGLIRGKLALKENDWTKFVDAYDTLLSKEAKSLEGIVTWFNRWGIDLSFDLKPSIDIDKLGKIAENKYEMLQFVHSARTFHYYHREGEFDAAAKKVANYINVIDVCNSSHSL